MKNDTPLLKSVYIIYNSLITLGSSDMSQNQERTKQNKRKYKNYFHHL